jgi:hypothetical protein
MDAKKHNWTAEDIDRIVKEINASILARREAQAKEDNEPCPEIVLDAEDATLLCDKTWRHHCNMLRLLSQIHGEIAEEVNRNREALLDVFSRIEDRYIPLDGTDLVELELDIAKQEQVHQLP